MTSTNVGLFLSIFYELILWVVQQSLAGIPHVPDKIEKCTAQQYM